MLAAAVASAAGVAATSVASGQLCKPCVHEVGLVTFYTHQKNTCTGSPIDPINVVWFDTRATKPFSVQVASLFSVHTFDGWLQEDSADDSADQQGVRRTTGFVCVNETTGVANGPPTAGDRGHVRLYDTYTPSNQQLHVVGDAHEDRNVFCHGTIKHITATPNGFLTIKRAMHGFWPGPKHPEFWGNTRPILQCNGHTAASNGWTAVMQGYH